MVLLLPLPTRDGIQLRLCLPASAAADAHTGPDMHTTSLPRGMPVPTHHPTHPTCRTYNPEEGRGRKQSKKELAKKLRSGTASKSS